MSLVVSSNGDVTYLGDPVTKRNAYAVAKELSSYIGLMGTFSNNLTALNTDLCKYRVEKSKDQWDIVVSRIHIFKKSAFNLRCISDALVRAILEEKENETLKPNRLDRVCPLSFASGKPSECREDCAWFVTPERWEEGCCAITCIAACSNFISSDIEEIAAEAFDATP